MGLWAYRLELCQRLWTEPVVDYDDGELRYERIHAMPKPLGPGGVPVWVSGRVNARTVQRVARFGCGWIPWGDDMTDPRPGIEVMRNALTAAGREGSSLQVQGTLPVVRVGGVIDIDATMAGVPALVTAGVTDFRWHHRWGSEIAESERVMTDVVSAFRATVGRMT